jgi:hypothetical protein
MPELKKIRVRRAKPRDVGLFKKLWAESLEQQAKAGSIVAATERTLDAYVRLFNVYVEGDYEGVVLFVADKGVLMWGDAGSPMDYGAGRMLTDWGLYVTTMESSEDIQQALQEYALKWAKEHEFNGILTDVHGDAKHPAGSKPVLTVVYRSLD